MGRPGKLKERRRVDGRMGTPNRHRLYLSQLVRSSRFSLSAVILHSFHRESIQTGGGWVSLSSGGGQARHQQASDDTGVLHLHHDTSTSRHH